jgi:hypothetical protein
MQLRVSVKKFSSHTSSLGGWRYLENVFTNEGEFVQTHVPGIVLIVGIGVVLTGLHRMVPTTSETSTLTLERMVPIIILKMESYRA